MFEVEFRGVKCDEDLFERKDDLYSKLNVKHFHFAKIYFHVISINN